MGNVPEQVRRAAERANELHNQVYGQPANPEEPQTPEEPEAQPPEVEQAAEPPAAPTEETPQSEQPSPAPEAEKPTDWEHKYRSLQGVLSAEQRAWKAEKAQLEARIQALEAATKQASQQPDPAPPKVSRLTQQDIETYGPELVDVIKRAAAEMADEIVAQRMQEIKPELEQTRKKVTEVAGTVYQNAQERFFGELAKAVPDWQQINTDQRWLDWLGEIDPLSGVPRQVYLDNASHRLDHERTAALFKAFKEAAGLNKPAEPAPAPAAPTKPQLSPQPRTVGNAVAPTPRTPEVGVTRAEIDAHYRRASMDRAYRTSQEYQAMEQRIATALAAGRIS